jgi:hypothetical protein
MEALTKEQVSLLLAGTRNRGGHERNIRKFIESGELYVTVRTSLSMRLRIRPC